MHLEKIYLKVEDRKKGRKRRHFYCKAAPRCRIQKNNFFISYKANKTSRKHNKWPILAILPVILCKIIFSSPVQSLYQPKIHASITLSASKRIRCTAVMYSFLSLIFLSTIFILELCSFSDTELGNQRTRQREEKTLCQFSRGTLNESQ